MCIYTSRTIDKIIVNTLDVYQYFRYDMLFTSHGDKKPNNSRGVNMHDSMKRLHEVSGISRKNVLAKQLKVSPSTVTNWGSRGVSKEGALDAAELYNCDANYILDGDESRKPEIIDAPIKEETGKDGFAGTLMPVFRAVSIDSYNDTNSTDIVDWLPTLPHLAPNSFGFVVAGRTMTPEFTANEITIIDTNITIDQLQDGDFVLVQDKEAEHATLKQVNLGTGFGDIYLRQLNDDMPNAGLLQINQFYLLGIVDRKVKKYR